MKQLKIAILTLLALTGLGSCEEDGELVTVTPQGGSTLLEVDITTIELDRVNVTNPALTLVWEDASYSVQTPVSYQLEFGSDDTFTDSARSAVITSNSITLSVDEVNSFASSAGLPPFEWNDLYIRVASFLGSVPGAAETLSNSVSINILTYYNYPFVDHYLVGPASASGWDNNNNNAVLFRDASKPGEFKYTGRFNSGPLKFLEIRGAWAPQYGEGENDGQLSYRATENDEDPPAINNLESMDAGYYTFSVDVDRLTFTILAYEETLPTPLSSLTVNGSALAAEATLTQYGVGGEIFDEYIWYIPSVRLVPGEFTFTANGSDVWGGTTLFSGVATPNGGSIPVDIEDDYEIWFNSITGDYHLIPINLSQS
ncbi:SusE domain-containing protein [Allomuricauda sp. SCSIO 65647]|uniref:SusE domain-containing protein n=1 Tax=Allomuricauda sp. SCSIO 65647 TaxID=2908843 RepID=UPI001F399BEB|nr:SusE domain-containing protein [Muricauda sp. SCSIO 65647]UJH66244.1 SusE domain-containing protein [Muricauda sp. SCSIO 65647]